MANCWEFVTYMPWIKLTEWKVSLHWKIINPHFIGSVQFSSVAQSYPTLQPHGLQHARPPYPSPTPRVYPNSCTLSQWCHPTISVNPFPPAFNLSQLLSLMLQSSSIRGFSNESALRIRWPKYWNFSFNISPSSEHSGLISFRMDWLDLLTVSQESSPTPQFKSINSSFHR